MKRNFATIALITSFLVASLSAHAQVQFTTGNKLLRFFNGGDVENTYAMGYVIGIADVHAGSTVCVSQGVEVGQVVDVVRRELDRAPEVRHFNADVLVHGILRNTYPCAKGKRVPSSGTSL